MKCISLWQPWASLVVFGEKRYETRSWPIRIRGTLLIHAAKHEGEMHLCGADPFRDALRRHGLSTYGDVPRGAILGAVRVVENEATWKVRDQITEKERAFGNYADGRFAWKLADPVVFAEPVAYRGSQGLFEVNDPRVIEAVNRARRVSP